MFVILDLVFNPQDMETKFLIFIPTDFIFGNGKTKQKSQIQSVTLAKIVIEWQESLELFSKRE